MRWPPELQLLPPARFSWYGGFLKWGYPNSLMVYGGKSYWHGWFGGTPMDLDTSNIYLFGLPNFQTQAFSFKLYIASTASIWVGLWGGDFWCCCPFFKTPVARLQSVHPYDPNIMWFQHWTIGVGIKCSSWGSYWAHVFFSPWRPSIKHIIGSWAIVSIGTKAKKTKPTPVMGA